MEKKEYLVSRDTDLYEIEFPFASSMHDTSREETKEMDVEELGGYGKYEVRRGSESVQAREVEPDDEDHHEAGIEENVHQEVGAETDEDEIVEEDQLGHKQRKKHTPI